MKYSNDGCVCACVCMCVCMCVCVCVFVCVCVGVCGGVSAHAGVCVSASLVLPDTKRGVM